MEGKIVILSVLIMSFFMTQIQVEARSCCPTALARNAYNVCRLSLSRPQCARLSGCRLVSESTCPSGFLRENLDNSGGHDVNKYCNAGCVSSVCGALTTLEKSDNQDASEIVNEALHEKCIKACSTLCATGSKTALDRIALHRIALDQNA